MSPRMVSLNWLITGALYSNSISLTLIIIGLVKNIQRIAKVNTKTPKIARRGLMMVTNMN
jgi:hypothetical protein